MTIAQAQRILDSTTSRWLTKGPGDFIYAVVRVEGNKLMGVLYVPELTDIVVIRELES